MPTRAKIAISEPGTETGRRYFSLRLKQSLSVEPTEYRDPHKLLVIRNIQGDFHVFRELLISVGIIDKKYHWIFGDGHLVITGDCLGENEIGTECLWLVYALEEKAKRKGGYVHFILGKNEINNLNGSWHRLQPRYAKSRRTSKAPYVVLYDGNSELRRWLGTKNIVEKIGSVFVSNTDINTEAPLDLPLTLINKLARQSYYRTNELRAKNPDVFHQEPAIVENNKITALLIKDDQLCPINIA